ncbi:MAG: cadmium-translocating P-type ATPase [Clostridia bacterium]|nr:cadmium-translocating P-type ATPase [Clostridia bacterium]
MKKVFLLKGLSCPNCAAKIEKEVGEIPEVNVSAVNLVNQSLTIELSEEYSGDIYKEIVKIIHSHEPDVEVCGKNEDLAKKTEKKNFTAVKIAVGAAVYIAEIIISHIFGIPLYIELGILLVSYIILGGNVVLQAVKNILKGRIFDENFLMTISTIGAFCIGSYTEAVAVMLFYQIGEYFQDMAVSRSRRSIADLMDIRPDCASVKRGEDVKVVAPEDVAVGELIIVKPGEKIPLDGVVVEGEAMADTAALTGESVPRHLRKGDEALSGFVNQNGVLTIRVTKTAGESTVAKIIDLVENAAARKAPAENFITTFSRYYTPVVVILAAILAVIPPLVLGGAWTDWIRRGLVFLVISCPCALVISIPLSFFGGIGAASRKGVLIKGSNYLDALNKVDTVVFDKTGTLTKGVFNVTEIINANGHSKSDVLEYAAKAESFSNHPIAKSILRMYGKNINKTTVNKYEELSGRGVRIVGDGRSIIAGSEKAMKEFEIDFKPVENPGTKVYVAVDGSFAGCIVISDEIKEDSEKAVSELRSLGINMTVMLTGDDMKTAEAVAEKTGIDEYYAELLPDQKAERLEKLKKGKRGKIAFVGDGINDAPVLALADVGIAMGALGSDAAIEAADIVLMTDEPARITEAVKISKFTKRIVLQNIIFALSVKGIFLILGAFGVAGMWEAVFGDVGVMIIAVLNAMRILRK